MASTTASSGSNSPNDVAPNGADTSARGGARAGGGATGEGEQEEEGGTCCAIATMVGRDS